MTFLSITWAFYRVFRPAAGGNNFWNLEFLMSLLHHTHILLSPPPGQKKIGVFAFFSSWFPLLFLPTELTEFVFLWDYVPSSLRPIFGTYALAAGDLSHLTNEVKCTVLFEATELHLPLLHLSFSPLMKARMKKNVIVLLYY